MQEKLLRIIEYGQFERVGGGEALQVDVRVVAATNVHLPDLAASGKFRADLLDRLSFDVITVPPLRARREDITILADHFAQKMTAELKREYFPGFTQSATETLLRHDWPGNVRELRNTVERSVYRMSDPEKRLSDIILDPFASANSPSAPITVPPALAPLQPPPSPSPTAASPTPPAPTKPGYCARRWTPAALTKPKPPAAWGSATTNSAIISGLHGMLPGGESAKAKEG